MTIGVITMIPLVDAYKPFGNLVLIVFVPVAILFLDRLRTVAQRASGEIVRSAVGFGLAFGVMCLMYAGWFQWAAPGLFVATLILIPEIKSGRGAKSAAALTEEVSE